MGVTEGSVSLLKGRRGAMVEGRRAMAEGRRAMVEVRSLMMRRRRRKGSHVGNCERDLAN
jgi:hypothetical protein